MPNPAIIFGGLGDDVDAAAWFDAVKAAGAQRPAVWQMARIDRTIRRLKYIASGSIWSKLDDLLIYSTEDAIQARVSLKRRITQLVGGGAPTHVPLKHYTFNGSSDYLRTLFTPSTDAVSMTGASTFLGIYETVNLSQSSVYAAGAINNTSTQGVRVNPKTGSVMSGQVNSAVFGSGSTITTSIGLCAMQQDGGVFSTWYKGRAAGTGAPGTSGTTLTTREYYVGCFNNNGTPAGYRSASIGAVVYGAGLTADEHLFLSAVLSNHLSAVGAIQA